MLNLGAKLQGRVGPGITQDPTTLQRHEGTSWHRTHKGTDSAGTSHKLNIVVRTSGGRRFGVWGAIGMVPGGQGVARPIGSTGR